MKKKFISLLILLAMALSLTAGMGISASAESAIKNVIKKGGQEESFTQEPEDDLLKLLEDCSVTQMPKKSSYLDEPITMYMDSGSTEGAYAYREPAGNARTVANIYQGVSVQLLAIEDDWGIVVFYNSSNVKKAGWAYLENLSSEYPGETISFGKENLESCEMWHGNEYKPVQPEIEWSKFNFVDTKTKYTVIAEPWCDYPCAALVFDYQVTSRNGVQRAYGERDVYINGGDGWEYVGSFEVEADMDAVRCEIYFDEPKLVKAIASIPVGASAENFVFRQAVECAYYNLG